jgi:predicted kinase
VNLDVYRLAKQNGLSVVMHHINNIDEVMNKRLNALKEMEKDKARVKSKLFQVRG